MKVLDSFIVDPASIVFEIPVALFQTYIVNNEITFAFVNKVFETEFELLPGRVLGYFDAFVKLLSDLDQKFFLSSLEQSFNNLDTWNWQGCFNLPSGEKKWMQGKGTAILECDQKVRLNGFFTNVTEIRHTHDMFKAAGKLSKTGAWEIDLQKNTVYWSQEVYSIHEVDLGINPDLQEAINYYKPEARPIIIAAVERSIEDGNGWDLELPIITAKGNHRWIRTLGETLLVKNKVVKIFGVFQDITGQKKAEAIIKRKEAILSETQALTHSGSWETDLSTGKNYWSAEAFRIFGLKPEIDGPESLTFGRMIHPDDRGIYSAAIKNTMALLETSSFDLRIVLPTTGEIRYIHAIGKPLTNSSGKIVKLHGAIVDITARKMAEQEVLKAKELAEQAAVIKSQFLSAMSHEIRTPMNAMIGFTNLLMQKDPTEEQLEYLKILKFSGNNLLVLINDILDFSKIEAGKVDFEVIGFSMVNLLENIHKSFLQRAQEKGLILKLTIDKNITDQVLGDPVRLGQILTNLINNAVKFTAQGEIIISVRLKEYTTRQTAINFEISDTGIGIGADKLDSIFERFTQASSDTTRQYGGTGLGLTITKKLIELQNGNITLESKLGRGSTFKFTLSFENSTVKQAKEEQPAVKVINKSLKGTRILLAEDNQINILLIKQFMKLWEVECDVAVDGLKAVEQVREKDYDLILMDLQMPEMDGYDATVQIRNMPEKKYKLIPIIALTASAMADIQGKVLQYGMNDYISKPFNPDDLYSKISCYSGR